MVPFVHLHVHSYYSILDGQAPLEALISKAKADGMPGIALTDHGAMFGIKSFADLVAKGNSPIEKKMKQLKQEIEELEGKDEEKEAELQVKYEALSKSRFKPIYGCEAYCARRNRHLKDKSAPDPYRPSRSIDASGWHIILLAKDLTGYHNLIKMVSLAYTEGEYYRPRIDKELLEKYHEGIIVCSACLGGEIPQHIMAGHTERAEESIRWFKSIFGEDFYLEVQLHRTDKPNANRETYLEQLKVNEVIYDLAERLDVKVVATNDVHFVDEEDAEAHDRLICLSTKKDFDDPTRMHYSKQEWLKSTAEMNDIFADHPEVLSNTLEVLDKVSFYSIDRSPIMPYFELPEGFANEDEYLRHITYEGARERYGETLSDEIRERIDFELKTVCSMGYPGYFLIVWDFIKAAREREVMVGPGRGSAAGSVVAYCLRIVDLDPIHYGLLFERFLNPDRISMPDIDVDIEDSGRDIVLDYVKNKYGEENVARVITFGVMKAKSAFNDMARVEKVPIPESRRISKLIPDAIEGEKSVTLPIAIEKTPELKALARSKDPKLVNTFRYAMRLENTVRNIGVHACAVIISGEPINGVVPIAQVRDSDGNDVTITQYKGEIIEDTGLIKMDFLGLQTLTIIKEALVNIKHRHGIDIDIEHIPLNDEKTFKLYGEGRTIGTFQFESPGMRKHLINLKPNRFEDLIAMNALYRPGPMDNIPDFIERKHGRKRVEYDLPVMEDILKETYGVTVYQEQVMILSRLLAGFSRGDSDSLRKAMGKKKEDLLKKLEGKFFEGGLKNGHDKKVLEKIWKDWLKFASYAFNKSHSACYAWVAYQTAYLKAHYQSEFLAGNLSCMLSKADEVAKLMEECQEMQIKVLPPDVNLSLKKFSVDQDGNIRFGLGAIKGVSSGGMDAIIEEREKSGAFCDVYDFISRLPKRALSRKTLEGLVLSGALDSFGTKREDYFAPPAEGGEESFLTALVAYAKNIHDDGVSRQQNTLFGDVEEVQITKPTPTVAPEWNRLELLNKEKELIGLFISGNPLEPYELILKYYCNTEVSDLADLKPLLGRRITFAGMITKVFQGTTKNDKPYGRVTVEDLSGMHEFFVFGQEYLDHANYFREGLFIFFSADVEASKHRGNSPELKIISACLLSDVTEKLVRSVTIGVIPEEVTQDFATELIEGVKANPGKAELILHIASPVSHHCVNCIANKHCITPGHWLSQLVNRYHLSPILK